MPIAPITGKLRKRLWLDLSCGLGFGISAAYAYWYGIHLKSGQCGEWISDPSLYLKQFADTLPTVQRQEEFYLKLERQKQIA